MTFYAVYVNEFGEEESVQVADGPLFTFNSSLYPASLKKLIEFISDKQLVTGKGQKVTISFMLGHVKKQQAVPETYALLYENMVTGSDLNLSLDDETKTFFKWVK